MDTAITIVDRGRGPQLSTSRITVQDLVPMFQRHCTYEEILEAMPSLTRAEIEVVERYIGEHREEVEAQDRRIRERAAQRRNSPKIEAILRRGGEKMAALRVKLEQDSSMGRNGGQ